MSLSERFWAKVDRRSDEECWPWTAATNEHGYGVIRPEGRRSGPTLKAHRVALQLAGVDVEGQVVRHSCDNPPCVNPLHLTVGSQADNIADMHDRGRGNLGSVNGQAKLTEAQVVEIRRRVADGEMKKRLAIEYGVDPSTITAVIKRKTWRHVA
ncbi:MAG: sle1 [Ornithinibacter sp.]|jgi:hypothetical protein|nr:sle1 [Ornithinibacter sp.]